MLDLPEAIAEVFNSGRTTDVTAINELVTCHRDNPEATVAWMAEQEISRGTVKNLKGFIATKGKTQRSAPKFGKAEGHHPNPDQASPAPTLRKPVIGVECDRTKGTLLYLKHPTKAGCAWVCIESKNARSKSTKFGCSPRPAVEIDVPKGEVALPSPLQRRSWHLKASAATPTPSRF